MVFPRKNQRKSKYRRVRPSVPAVRSVRPRASHARARTHEMTHIAAIARVVDARASAPSSSRGAILACAIYPRFGATTKSQINPPSPDFSRRGALGTRRVPSSSRGAALATRAMMYNGEEIWDPDERRRIEENKSWKRSDSPTEAWDIDKERDAVMYKRESLERLLSMTRDDVPKVDRAVVCGECKTRVSRRSDEGEKDKAFLHRRQYGEGFVSLGVYKSADVDAVEDSPEDARASQWWPPRRATKCRCRGCGCVLGWRVSDNPQEIVGVFYALLSSKLMTGPEIDEE